MNAEEGLTFADELVFAKTGKRLDDLQRAIFLGSWQGKSYKEIQKDCSARCGLDHIMRNVGPNLWKLLSRVLGEKVTKNCLQAPLTRIWNRIEQSQKTRLQSIPEDILPQVREEKKVTIADWGEAPDEEVSKRNFRAALQRASLTNNGTMGAQNLVLGVDEAKRLHERSPSSDLPELYTEPDSFDCEVEQESQSPTLNLHQEEQSHFPQGTDISQAFKEPSDLEKRMRAWFEALGYELIPGGTRQENCFDLIASSLTEFVDCLVL